MSETRKSRVLCDVDFDRDGRQTGFLRLFHSSHVSAYGFLPIPIVVLRNGEGPTALFVSGNHGDEYEGQLALCGLAQSLDPERIRGRVIILPTANYPAALAGNRVSPVDNLNLNRIFPGDPDGSVTEQIAYFISSELIPRADLVCDLHSGGSSLLYTPCSLTNHVADPDLFRRQIAALRAFGAPLGYVQGRAQGQGGNLTLGGVAERRGIVTLGTELGGAGAVSAEGLAIARRGVRNLLVHLGILPETEREPAEETRIYGLGGQDHFVYAPEGGVFEPLAEPGETVRAGQPAARIHTPETPWAPPAEAVFARDGFVLCKRQPGRTLRGDCLYVLGGPFTPSG
ncbi:MULTISPECIES: succinylglutamate desuccinylase/aspartoacylase family protein [Acetobacterales]|uniref:succinylglutamate desuccinylase/aspartoacylase family protein n=1 Tax=Roseomonas sp. WGS1072 TaxID=3366816 RepID=UPI003BF2B966